MVSKIGSSPAARSDAKALFAAPGIACVLVLSWLLPLEWWALTIVGGLSTLILAAVALAYRRLGRRLLTKPALVAASVMWAIAVFTVAYGWLALEQVHSVQTNGTAAPTSVGVVALLASAMGIAGGEVGVHVQEGARIVAHVQLLVVLGAVAGVGGQVVQRLAGDDDAPAPPPPEPRSLVLDLYRRVHDWLSAEEGSAALDELRIYEPDARMAKKRLLRSLPNPETITEPRALEVFQQISAGDLEFTYPVRFEGGRLGPIVRGMLEGR
jgi:hypothetical protein